MNNKLKIGILLMTPNADPLRDNAQLNNDDALIMIYWVNSLEQAKLYAKVFSDLSFDRIEMCPSFDPAAVETIRQIAGPNMSVGVVEFKQFVR